MSPEQGVELSYDVIVILSFYVKSMRKQLLDLGVPEEKIYHFYDLHRLVKCKDFAYPVEYYGDAKKAVEGERQKKANYFDVSGSHTGRSCDCFISCGGCVEKMGIYGSLCVHVGRPIKRETSGE